MKITAIGLLYFCLAVWAAPQAAPPAPQEPSPQGSSPQQPGQTTVEAPPELPKYPDVRLPGEYGMWISLQGWVPQSQPTFDKGRNAGYTVSSAVTMQGTPKLAAGGEIGFAVGHHNAVRASYFTTRASGNFTNSEELLLWSQDYPTGTYLATDYRLQDVKLSFDYLTWPFPVESRRFRLKTLWQVQYVSVKTGFDAPRLPTTDTAGNPLYDSNGNLLTYATSGTRGYFTPTLGIGIAQYFSNNVRFEANATGFTIPHHTTTWDIDATVNFRVGHFEVGAGARAFHFKTSTNGPFYARGTLYAPAAQIRWYSH